MYQFFVVRNRSAWRFGAAFVSLIIAAGLLLQPILKGEALAADKYPSKPITILIGFAVGGGADTAARLQGDALAKILGVPVTVKNVPGAGGRNAVTLLERAEPDGYTMASINVPGQVVNQSVRGMKPDLRKFVWIGRQVSQRYFIQASKKSGIQSLADLKKRKEPVKAGITGTGGNTFPISVIATEIVGYPVRFVPGFTGPELITAIIRGDIDITTIPLLTPFISAVEKGEAAALAIYGPGKHPLWPDIKTGDEVGHPELTQDALVGENLYGLPPGTPAAIAQTLEQALTTALADEMVVKKVESNGNLVRPLTGKQGGQLLEDMINLVDKHKQVLKKYVK